MENHWHGSKRDRQKFILERDFWKQREQICEWQDRSLKPDSRLEREKRGRVPARKEMQWEQECAGG